MAINSLVPPTGARITTIMLVPPTAARITTIMLVPPTGARTHRKHAGSTDRCLYSPKTCCFHRPVPILTKNVLVPPNGARTRNKPAGPTDRCTDKPRTAFKKPYDAHRQTTCTKVYSTSAVPLWVGHTNIL